jgi:hypothetical protein
MIEPASAGLQLRESRAVMAAKAVGKHAEVLFGIFRSLIQRWKRWSNNPSGKPDKSD